MYFDSVNLVKCCSQNIWVIYGLRFEMAQRTSISTTRALYKYLMRQTEELPADAKTFYRSSIRRVSCAEVGKFAILDLSNHLPKYVGYKFQFIPSLIYTPSCIPQFLLYNN